MLNVHVFWKEIQTREITDQIVKDFQDKGLRFTSTRYSVTSGNNRHEIVNSFIFEDKVQGTNPDEIHFHCIPNSRQRDLAINRTLAKKGKVYIKGRLEYDHNGETKAKN